MGYFYYNPNPYRKSVGDCAVRAISKAMEQDWDTTYVGICLEGFCRGDMPDGDSVWGPYLREHGFTRNLMSDECPDGYTVADFAADHPNGTYILSMPGRHVLCVQNGHWYDSWDSGGEVPVYYWMKKEGA